MGLGTWTHGGTDVYKLTDHNNIIFYWEQNSNVETNKSAIYWEVRLTSDAYGEIKSTQKKSITLKLGLGSYPVENVDISIGPNTQKLLASAYATDKISHNMDGTGSVYYTLYVDVGITFGDKYIGTVKYNGEMELEQIPRKSIVTVSGSTTIGEEMKFNFTRYNSQFTDTITYQFGNYTGTIVENTRNTVVSWTIPKTLYNYLGATATQKECVFTITTAGAYDLEPTVITKTLSINPDDCMPYFYDDDPIYRFDVSDINKQTLALTHDNQKIIKDFNTVKFWFTARSRYGAYIKTIEIKANDKTLYSEDYSSFYPKKSSVGVELDVDNLSDGNIYVKITDSRDISTTRAHYLKTIDYTKLTCSISDILFDEDTGVANIKIGGKFFKDKFDNDLPYIGETNTLTIQYRYRLNSGSYPSEWTTAYTGAGDEVLNGYNNYSKTIEITGLNPKLAYYVEIRVNDKLMDITLDGRSLTIVPVFNWGKGDFQFNVPVSCDEGLNIEGQPVKDFVVATGTAAMGTNGTWYWQKWNSGRAECYGCRNYGNMGVSTAWGVLFRSEVFNQALPSGLFLNMPDVVDISFRNSDFGAWIAKHETSAPSETNTGSFIVVRPASATLSQAKISFNVIGRWK